MKEVIRNAIKKTAYYMLLFVLRKGTAARETETTVGGGAHRGRESGEGAEE